MGPLPIPQAVSLGFGVRLVSLLLGLFVSLTPSASLAQLASSDAVAAEDPGPSNAHAAERLTERLHALKTEYRAADLVEQARVLPKLLKEAATRHRLVRALIETDPGAALRIALPAHLRAGLPPEVQVLVEEETEEEGTLEVLHEDRNVGSRYRYFLKTAAGRLSLHFAADPPALQTGTRVRAHGVRLSGAMARSEEHTSELQSPDHLVCR